MASNIRKMKFYRNNPLLKGTGVQISYTQEQLEEYIKCKNDPIYFIKNYVKIVEIDKGLVNFELYDFQAEFVELLHNNNKVVGAWARQHGKCQHKLTKIVIRHDDLYDGEAFEIEIGMFYEWQRYIKAFSGQVGKGGLDNTINTI